MKFRPSPTALFAILALASAIAVRADTFTDRFERSYVTGPGVEVVLGNTNGGVSVEAWDEDVVLVVAEKRVSSNDERDAQEAFEAMEIVIHESVGRLEIETRTPSMNSGFFDWILGRARNAQVRYELRVPRTAELDLQTVNGHLATSGAGGPQLLKSTNGGLTVEAAGGEVEAHTTNGSIRVEIADVGTGPDVKLGSTNGGITLYLPSDLQGRIEARTVNGSVKTDLPVTIDGSTSRRRLRGELNGGGASRIEIKTTNGGIRIKAGPRDES